MYIYILHMIHDLQEFIRRINGYSPNFGTIARRLLSGSKALLDK